MDTSPLCFVRSEQTDYSKAAKRVSKYNIKRKRMRVYRKQNVKDNPFFQLGNGIVKDILSSSHELGKRSLSDDLSPSEYSNLCRPAVEH